MTVAQATVLVVEDEESFVEALSVGLKREGFRVVVARDGPEALSRFDIVAPDIVLLDVMLSCISGVDVCREISTRSKIPILMVSAKTSEIDMVVALEVGADDYVAKPYRIRELVARMRAALRRSPPGVEVDQRSVLEVGDVRLDPARHEVFVRGAGVKLTLKEFELLAALLESAGRVLTRNSLIDQVWGSHYVGDTKTLDVHVKRVRAKIEEDPSAPSRILTIRGLGYNSNPDGLERKLRSGHDRRGRGRWIVIGPAAVSMPECDRALPRSPISALRLRSAHTHLTGSRPPRFS